MSRATDEAPTETEYLLRSPRNAERLLNSIQSAHRGEVGHHELVEVADE